MPGVVTIRQPLTILSLTGLRSPPTTEEHNQKLPFTLGKCPVSSTNQSSPIKEECKHCWQPTMLCRASIWRCRGEGREISKIVPESKLFHQHSWIKGASTGGGIIRHCFFFMSHIQSVVRSSLLSDGSYIPPNFCVSTAYFLVQQSVLEPLGLCAQILTTNAAY